MGGPAASQSENINQKPLWKPDLVQVKDSKLANFSQFAAGQTGSDLGGFDAEGYRKLHAWSVQQKEEFWSAVWDFCGVVGDKGQTVLEQTKDVPWARWFPGSKISYTENMLKYWLAHPHDPAIIYRLQDEPDRILIGKQLCDEVSRWEQALAKAGVGEGDCVGVYLSNVPETDIILLAAANLGATFCSAGMEMGGDDMVARFGQVKPKILITAEGYVHGEKTIDRTAIIVRAQREIPSIKKTVLLPDREFLKGIEAKPLTFTRRDFNHPLYILFSSGSTGAPKCFVHSSGGVLLKHLCEYQLNSDVRPGDRVFYHATPSWMMWNWASSALASGAAILKYDGNPFYPDAGAQWRFTCDHGCTHHGTAAPVIMGWKEAGLKLNAKDYDLSALRAILYTGAVLPASGFDYVYKDIAQNLPLFGIAGGTDLVGCHVGGNPFTPVYAGQVPGPMLGMDIQIWDEDGKPVKPGEAGELVCASPFPSMPLRFLNDEAGARYRDAYFDFYPGRQVWRHGDSIQMTPQGQLVIIGRSDATLNQNGVRIGTGTIYAQVDKIASPLVRGRAAVDFARPDNGQAITVLFLALENYQGGVPLELEKAIKKAVKDNVGPYSVPSEIIAVPGVLKTPNGKLAEVVMKKILAGKEIPNASLYGEELVGFYQQIFKALQSKYRTGTH